MQKESGRTEVSSWFGNLEYEHIGLLREWQIAAMSAF